MIQPIAFDSLQAAISGVYGQQEVIGAGVLMYYGASVSDITRLAVTCVD